jgi:hypothetical protein
MLSGQTGGALASRRWTCTHKKTLFIFQSFHHFLLLVLLSPLFNHKINYSFPRYASLTTTKYERKNNETLMMMLDIFKMTRASFIFYVEFFLFLHCNNFSFHISGKNQPRKMFKFKIHLSQKVDGSD